MRITNMHWKISFLLVIGYVAMVPSQERRSNSCNSFNCNNEADKTFIVKWVLGPDSRYYLTYTNLPRSELPTKSLTIATQEPIMIPESGASPGLGGSEPRPIMPTYMPSVQPNRFDLPEVVTRLSADPQTPSTTPLYNMLQPYPRPTQAAVTTPAPFHTQSSACNVQLQSKPVTNIESVPARFSAKLFQLLAPANQHKNIVYSPISLQALLAFVYIGAEGRTAAELQQALELTGYDKAEVAYIFEKLLSAQPHMSTANDVTPNTTQLIFANKMYYANNLQPCASNNFERKYFKSELEPINFQASPNEAARSINSWVSQATRQRINELVSPSSLTPDTQAILVNAIYFKAKWAKEFSSSDTQSEKFHITKDQKVSVDMMYNDDEFRFADLSSELNAKMLELPYLNTNLSMLIILPNDITGLPELEQKLQGFSVTGLAAKLKQESVVVRMPKFKVEFELDMVQPLERLNVKQLFSDNAELPGFFQNNNKVRVSKVQHKAYIDVNEAGSEAAAASFAELIPLSLQPKQIYFTVNHPFMFIIRDANVVYFIGHVVKF